jgi:hypothetical protein
MTDDPYTKAHIETQRDALAMAIHAARSDMEFVAHTFNNSENPELLIHQLARLPYLLVTGTAKSFDAEVDFTAEAEEMLRGLPRTVEEVDRLIDGEEPFADEDDDE